MAGTNFLGNNLGDTCGKSFYSYNRTNYDTDEAPKVAECIKMFVTHMKTACVFQIYIYDFYTHRYVSREVLLLQRSSDIYAVKLF